MTREREDFFEHLRKPVKPKAGFSARSAVKALKESVQSVGHKTGLPGDLLELFRPRPTLPQGTELQKKKPKQPATGIAHLVERFAAPGDEEYEPQPPSNRPPSPRLTRNRELPFQARIDTETKAEKKIRITQWKKEEAQAQVEEAARQWNPNKDARVQGDAFKTLFISHLGYDINDKRLRKEFEEYGPISNIRIVYDKAGKSRGYAFIEFEHKKDMKEAYKMADGRKIEGRRVVVDVERGRTVKNWRPRRLGGGLGGQGREAKLSKKLLKAGGMMMGGPPHGDDRRGPSDYVPRGAGPRPGGADDYRGPPRGGGDRDRDRGGDRDRDRERERERDAPRGGPPDDRKREREPSPRRRREDDSKRYRPEDDRRDGGRRRERDML